MLQRLRECQKYIPPKKMISAALLEMWILSCTFQIIVFDQFALIANYFAALFSKSHVSYSCNINRHKLKFSNGRHFCKNVDCISVDYYFLNLSGRTLSGIWLKSTDVTTDVLFKVYDILQVKLLLIRITFLFKISFKRYCQWRWWWS